MKKSNTLFIFGIAMLTLLVILFFFSFNNENTAHAAGPAPVDLLSTEDFAIVTKTGITNTGSHTSDITGDIGSSPITAAAMDNVFCSEITGTIYGVDTAYTGSGDVTCFAGAPADKTLIDNAVLDMGTAYADAAGRPTPTATELGAGDIGGMTLAPGLYKWSTDVSIPTDVTLSGGANDVWIFQIAGDLSIASGGSVPAGIKVLLSGGALATNVFWQVGGATGATLGTYSTFNGTILSAKQVIIQTGAVLNGRALSDTQTTLDANTISIPAAAPALATLNVIKEVVNNNAGTAVSSGFTLYVKNLGVDVSGSPASGVSAPGTSYSLSAGTYVVSEDDNSPYTSSFSEDCDSSGSVTLSPGDDKTCIITNTDTESVSSGGGGGGGGGSSSRSRASSIEPVIELVKSTNLSGSLPFGGGNVIYTYFVTNPGSLSLDNVTVTDDACLSIFGPSGDTNGNNLLDPGEIWVYACQINVSSSVTGTALAEGQANDLVVVDISAATVTVSFPGLPNTGMPSYLWITISLVIVFIGVSTSVVFLKKRKA